MADEITDVAGAAARSTATAGAAARPTGPTGPTGRRSLVRRRDTGRAIRRLGGRIFKPTHPLFTLGLLVAFVVIIAVVIYLLMRIGTYTITDPLYCYNVGIREELEGQSRVFRAEDDNIVDFTLQNNGVTLQLTEPLSRATSPLYWRDEERMFLPAMMSVIQPSQGIRPVRTGYYTEIRKDGDGFTARVDNHDVALTGAFLFDGQSVYVFLDDVTVSFLGQSVEMPAMSYAIVMGDLRLELYPYGGEPVLQQTGKTVVSVVGNGYVIDMTNDSLQAGTEQVLLFTTPSVLDVIE